MNAQIKTPAPSPYSKTVQVVGLTEFTVEYSRPSMKGRKIFGDLVPFDKVWRTGANARTKISFSDDITFGNDTLKKGTYAIFTKPNASSWDVYFYTDHAGGGAPQNWDESKVAAQIKVSPQNIPMPIESFTISFDSVAISSLKSHRAPCSTLFSANSVSHFRKALCSSSPMSSSI